MIGVNVGKPFSSYSKAPVVSSSQTVFTPSLDGYTETSNAVYLTGRNAASATTANTTNDGSAQASIQHSVSGGTYFFRRPILLFDTSAIGSGSTITAATLQIYRVNLGNNDDSDTYNLVSANPASNTSLVVADYSTLGTTSYGSAPIPASTVGAYVTLTLNSSGLAAISKTGITKFGIRTGGDINSVAPLGLDQIDFYFSEKGQSFAPKLTVTYNS